MIADPLYWCTLPVSFLAGLTQGLTGFGSALVAMPFYIEILPPKVAVSLSILNGLSIATILTARHRHDVRTAKVLPLILGAMPGVWIGSSFLKDADDDLVKRLLGVILICYTLYSLYKGNLTKKQISQAWSVPAGFLTGVIGAAFSAGGPPAIIYLSLTGWGKDEIKATLSAFFLVTGILISAGHLWLGITSPLTFRLFALNAPLLVSGVSAGMKAYARFPHEQYVRAVLVMLLLMGLILLL